ncbi:MAG TPA: putative aminohydrolase SsnA [Terriglobia bacterium]|nr:putative aminohydrolase SsnA [Terriglobia bacterium]
MIIRNARVLTFDSANRVLDSGAVEILPDGSIGQVEDTLADGRGTARRTLLVRSREKNKEGTASRTPTTQLAAPPPNPLLSKEGSTADHEIIDARGKLLMPALINCHTHLYSTLARGIPLAGRAPRNFPEILKKLWWRLDRALNLDDVYYSALVGLIDSAKCGVGTLVDHHSSPNACAGSLDQIEQAFREVGLRGVLCYETSDRNGSANAAEGIAENIRFLERHPSGSGDGLIAGSFGLHASFTLSDPTLRRAVEANESLRAGFHIHVAEDRCDVDDALRQYHKSPVERLRDLGILDDRSLAAHCVHVSYADIVALAKHHINVVHNPQSNCNNAVGIAPLLEMVRYGVLVGLGSDGYTPRMWEEFKAAFHVQKLRERDPRVAYEEAYAVALLTNRVIARKIWGWEIGSIETGSRADLLLVDYFPPTPLDGNNLFGHFLFGIANAPVDSLLVKGRFVLRHKECVTVDERAVAEKAAIHARALWERF